MTEPIHTADVTRNHLPAQLTSFVGRRRELDAIAALIEDSRLVTLTGVGGTGKTRLAVEAASRAEEDYPDGVWMVELAPVADPALVVGEVADLWGLRAGEGVDLIRVVKSHVARQTMLLVVDNCEHVLESAADLVAQLLAAAPGLTVIATSRESLGIGGEAVYRVPSLGLPERSSGADASDAVQLFLDRAAHKGGDDIPATEMEAVVRICRRLDGIPLGIELAAARLRTLSATELADRLDASFRILTGASKTAVSRQRTLQTAIDWSYDLLGEETAAVFRRLSVFAGGFDLAAAEAVGVDEAIQDWQVLDHIDQLVDKSLIVAAHHGGQTRFRMLEPIRQYGQERLAAAGEADAVYEAHARHYAGYVAEVAPGLRSREQRRANDELLAEWDNIRLALATLQDKGRADLLLLTCFDLTWFFNQSSLLVEGRELVLSALQSVGNEASDEAAARAWWEAAILATFLTDPRGIDYAERGLERARAGGLPGLEGWLSAARGMTARLLDPGRVDDRDWLAEGVRLVNESPGLPLFDGAWDDVFLDFMVLFAGGSPEGVEGPDTLPRQRAMSPGADAGHFLDSLVSRAMTVGDLNMAANVMTLATSVPDQDDWVLEQLHRSVEMLEELDFRHGLGHSLFYLGVETQDRGVGDGIDDLARASQMLAELGDLPCSTWSAARLIRALLDSDELDEAGRYLAGSVGRLIDFEREIPSDLPALACRYAVARGDNITAARALGHHLAHHADSDDEAARCLERLESILDVGELERRMAEGAATSPSEVLAWIQQAVATA